ELLYLVATASAVNELNLANAATGNAPSLTATGGDANVGIQLTPKGTGRTTVTQLTTTSPRVLTAINDTNGNELIGIIATASAVNEITVANAATGNNPVISATGGDTNVGITLTPKGTGAVKLSGLSYPTADGTANQVIQTNGSGVLSFATVSGSGSPGGSDTYVQFNDSGSFGGDAGLTYNKTTDTLSVNGVSVGRGAGSVSTNTAVGASALGANTTGADNTAVGYQTASGNTTGSENIAIGNSTLSSVTTGTRNVAVGHQALLGGSATSYNAILGWKAGRSVTSNGNVLIGYGAGFGTTPLTTGANNIHIGTETNPSANNVSNEIIIGFNGSTGKGTNTGFINPNSGGVYQGNNSSSWSTTSDRRLKKNIVDNNEGLDKISQIRVRNFEYRLPDEVDAELKSSDAVKKEGIQLGVIAQELQEVCPDCVKEESTGVLSVDSDNVFWHMVNAIKQLKIELDSVKAELATLKGAQA
ncbi:MAG: hypothetical protein EB117_17665, partial [Betaproteobacteria bacterium]|nr:hypothetical protein [Betaproteobacteria bacterium]